LKFLRLPAALAAIAAMLFTLGAPLRSRAADTGPVKIIVITDMSGIYSALAGEGAVVATKMAVADFGGKVLGRPIEVVVIDHRNNGPESAVKAREALDNGGDMLLDMTNSAVALADTAVAKEKHKLAIVTGAASSALTGANCNKYTYHYAYDTYALASSTGRNIARAGGKTWYGIVPNYAFGTQMLADFTAAIKPEGGKFIKADMIPTGNTDFSSYLLSAQKSGAEVLGVLNAGADTVNSMKAAKQFQLDKSMKIAVGLLFLARAEGALCGLALVWLVRSPVSRRAAGFTVTSTSWPSTLRNSISRPTDTDTGLQRISVEICAFVVPSSLAASFCVTPRFFSSL